MCPLRMGGIDEELSVMYSHVSHSQGSLAGVLPPSTDKMSGRESLYMSSAPYTVVQLQGFSTGLASGMDRSAEMMSPPPRPQGILGGRNRGAMPQRWEGYGNSNKKWMLDANNEVVDVSGIPGVVMQSQDVSPNRGNLSRYHSAPSSLLAGLVDDMREQGDSSYNSELDNLSELMGGKRCDSSYNSELDNLSELMGSKRCESTALATLAESADDEEPDSKTGGRVDDGGGFSKYDMGLPQQRYPIPLVSSVWPTQISPGSAGSNIQVGSGGGGGDFIADSGGKVGSGSPVQDAPDTPLKRNLQRHGSCPADFLDKLVIEETEQMEGIQRPFLVDTLARSPVKNVPGMLSLDGNSSSARDQMAMYARDEVMRDMLSPTESSKGPWNAADLEKNWFCASGSEPTLIRGQAVDPQSSSSTLTRFASLPSSLKPRSPQYGDTSIPCRTRAKRGCATHPRSIAERVRRTRIGERMKRLQELLPNLDKQSNTADMLDEAVDYIKELKRRVEDLECKVQEMSIRSCTS